MANRCVCCGAIIPEGLIACHNCLVVSNQPTIREKLTKLLDDNIQCSGVLGIDSCDTCPYRYIANCFTSAVVEHLLKNGVTILED
jgi:hypothetical protein